MFRPWHVFAAVLPLVLFAAGNSGAADRNGAAADKDFDPLAVPDGSTQELVAFIEGLMKQRPRDREMQAKLRQAVVKAAEKIIAARPDDKQLAFAVQAKGSMLDDLKEMSAFEDEIKRAGHKVVARWVHTRVLALQLVEAARDPAAFRRELDEVKKFLGPGPLPPDDAKLAVAAAQFAERTGDDRLAGETYADMAKLLGDQPELASMAKQMLACSRRLMLVGNPMQLEGKTLEGKDLDWAKLRGKVVLVDFWATWCGPCMAEVPNIKENYKKYHDKGFEVVGISLDRMEREKLAEFVKKEEVPWIICRDSDSPKPMADYYGVTGIPTMMLVGRDGRVITLHARGPRLGELVEKALAAAGEVAQDAPDRPGAEERAKLKEEKERQKAEEREAAKKKREEAMQAKAPKPRTWSDATGQFQVTATFRGVVNKMVRLAKEDGQVISVPQDKLSEADQEYIRQRKY